MENNQNLSYKTNDGKLEKSAENTVAAENIRAAGKCETDFSLDSLCKTEVETRASDSFSDSHTENVNDSESEPAEQTEVFEDSSDDVSGDNGDFVESDIEKARKKKEKKPFNVKQAKKVVSVAAASVFSLSAAVLSAAVLFILLTARTITVEVGETPELDKIHKSERLKSLYSIEKREIDVSKPSEHSLGVEFFGFYSTELTVKVTDTIPPTLTLTDIEAVVGVELEADDFVLSCIDSTDVSLSMSEIDFGKSGEYSVYVEAVDSCGNKTKEKATLILWDETHILSAELSAADLEAVIREKHPEITKTDLDDISTAEVGEYILHASSEDKSFIWRVKVEDTTPPQFKSVPVSVRLGEEIKAEDFVESVDDMSPYEVLFKKKPSTEKQGVLSAVIEVRDIYGNRSEKTVKTYVYDIPKTLEFEYGATEEEIKTALLASVEKSNLFSVSGISTEVGESTAVITFERAKYTVEIKISDTTPPLTELREVTVYKGDTVSAESFILSSYDLSEITVSFASGTPATEKIGKTDVVISVSDVYGNKTEKKGTLQVIADKEAPVIYGATDKTVNVGDNVSYKKGVYAVDAHDGKVPFKVDSSKVNTGAVGTYPVVYTAEDAAGNKAMVTVEIKVTEITLDSVYSLADGVLSKIVKSSMTDRQKAEQIYEWTVDALTYSTRTSYLMGNYVEGAYSGFNIKSGNCYIYYAVSSVLLTRAGIENIMLERDKPDDPHYWSLVKIDGNWYHFDTCPHYPGHDLRCFLLTDKEVREYSENEVEDYYSFDASKYPSTP